MSRIVFSEAELSPGPDEHRSAAVVDGAKRGDTVETTAAETASAAGDITEWEVRLARSFANFFPRSPRRPAFTRLPMCGPGWREIIERACERIAAVLTDREQFYFERIWERGGSLRFSWGGRLSAKSEAEVRLAIDLAEARSLCFCELCGAEARLYRDNFDDLTRCDAHAQGEPAPVRRGFENLHLRHKTIAGRIRTVVVSKYDPETDAFVDADPGSVPEEL